MALVSMILFLILSVGFWVAKKSAVNRWGSLLMFSGSLGSVSVLFYDPIIPYVLQHWGNESQLFFLSRMAHAIISCMSNYLPIYFYMGFCLAYSGFFKTVSTRLKVAVMCSLFIPPAYFFILYPPVMYYFPPYKAMLCWIIIYEIAGSTFLITSAVLEPNPRTKHVRIIVNFLFITTTAIYVLTIYVLRAIGIEYIWHITYSISIIIFLTFIYIIVKYGFMGLRVKVDTPHINGVKHFNHALKNRITTVELSCYNIRKFCSSFAEPSQVKSIEEVLCTIENSMSHLKELKSKLRYDAEELSIEKIPYNLNDAIDQVQSFMTADLDKEGIILSKKIYNSPNVYCDPTHTKETLICILKNSIEAIHQRKGKDDKFIKGEITMSIDVVKQHAVLYIKDNGIGIPREVMKHIFQPFFSTKDSSKNFGIGLTYCHGVMEVHKGKLSIESKENSGTTVALHFPLDNKIIKARKDEHNGRQ